MRDLWYKDAVIYCLDVETFQDDNADGIGDFPGLTDRLDHIAGLGATCIWLLPFYPTPNRDNGYDILDYYNVDPRLGTLGDFTEFVRQARERGLRVIVDLVVNHTSDQHPWFQAARADPDSPYRDYYVWTDEEPDDPAEPLIYDEGEGSGSVWEYDEKADAYYFHRFFPHQPDLNIANPLVREEIMRVMGFWLEIGVSGFRLDAAPYLVELRGIEEQAEVASPYEYLREFREFLSWRKGDAILLAEANVEPEQVKNYFGDGRRMHMLFNFVANQRLFLAMAREDAATLAEGLENPPDLPNATGQWAHFLRNHDELNLDKLTGSERQEVFDAFAPTEEEQIFGRGIRRRLPPMLGGDSAQTHMAYSLMLSLPGTPVLRYGQEIGMGDDLSLEGRKGVRTAMQWSEEKNGGFSRAAAEDLARPAISEGAYSFHEVNVEDQRNDAGSLLNWMERMIRLRKECGEIGWGEWDVIETGEKSVFAHVCRHRGRAVVAVHNLAAEERTVELDLAGLPDGHLNDLMTDTDYEPVDSGGAHRLRLEGYGYRWLRFRPDEEEAEAQRLPPPAPEELELNA